RVGLPGDRADRQHRGEEHGRARRGQHGAPCGARPVADRDGDERAPQHLTLERDVEDAGLGAEQTAEPGEQHGRAGGEHGGDEGEVEDVHADASCRLLARQRRTVRSANGMMMLAWITCASWCGTSASRSMPSEPACKMVKSATVTGSSTGRPPASSAAATPAKV